MRVLVLIAFFRIYDCQELSSARSVNLALETVLEFDNNDKSADLQIIDKVRGFLDRVKDIIDSNNENRRHSITHKAENHADKRAGNYAGKRARNYVSNHANNGLTFTDFAQKVVILLSTYKDKDLEDVVSILEDEMTKYHYKGCRFYELVDNYDLRRFVSDKLYQMRKNSAKHIRQQLDELKQRLANKNRGFKNKLITAYLDSLYKREDSAKLLYFLDKLTMYKRKPKRLDLVTIIRNGLRSIVFDHYSHMDYSTRRDFKVKLENFWKDRLSTESHRNIWKIEATSATRRRHIPTKKKVADSISSSVERSTRLMMQEPQKKRKRKRIVTNNVGKDVSRGKQLKKSSTKRPTKSFITLYPESMSYERRHKKHKPSKVPRKDRQRKTHDPIEEENKLFSVIRAKKFTDSKAGLSASKHVIVDETPTFTKKFYPIDEYKKVRMFPARKVRFNVVERLSTAETTTKRIRMKQNKDDARRFIEELTDQKTAETSEGLDIETFSSSGSSEQVTIHQFRKNNANDTLLVPLDNINTTKNTTATERANNTEFYVRRINDLEKELKFVKEKIVNTEKSDSDSKETTHSDLKNDSDSKEITHSDLKNESDSKETPHSDLKKDSNSKETMHYDSLQFWEGTLTDTAKVRHATSKLTTTTTQTPTDTEATILNTTTETTEDTTTIETTVESTTYVAPTNETLIISEVVPSDSAIDESKSVSDLRPNVTSVPAVDMETTEVPIKLVSTYNQLENQQTPPSRKDIPNAGNDTYDALDSEENEIKDAIHDLQIETLVEDPKGDDKKKSDKIQLKMMEDVKKIISDENEDKTTSPLQVSTINLDADPLSIMDEGVDVI